MFYVICIHFYKGRDAKKGCCVCIIIKTNIKQSKPCVNECEQWDGKAGELMKN